MVAPKSNPATVTAFDAKNRLGQLLDRVQAGEELVITRRGRAVASLVPMRKGGSDAAEALAVFKQVRQSLAAGGVRVSRKQVRAWRQEGRR